jgi:phage terminase small subunit
MFSRKKQRTLVGLAGDAMATDDCALAPKLDPVRERFAREYHATGNASEALRRAKPCAAKWKAETVHKRASEMLPTGEVQGRLEALQADAAKRHGTTIDSLTTELEAARDGAMSTGQFSAAVSAIGLKAKLHGLIKDKVANEFTGADGQLVTPIINASLCRPQ